MRDGKRILRAVHRLIALSVLVIVTVGAAPAAGQDLEDCAMQGGVPVIEPGREEEAVGLFSPYALGDAVGEPPGPFTFVRLQIHRSTIDVTIREGDEDGERGVLRLMPRACAGDLPVTPSFAVRRLVEPSSPRGRAALDAMFAALEANDAGGFYRSIAADSTTVEAPPASEEEPPSAILDGARHSADTLALAFAGPLRPTLAGIVAILLLTPFLLLLSGVYRLGDVRWTSRGLWIGGAVLAITVLGGLLRFGIDPTFIREAYALPSVPWFDEPPPWAGSYGDYPPGSELLTALIGPFLSADPYEAWFLTMPLFGTLTIPAAFALGAAITQRPVMGAALAAMIAFWPQHIRVSASESAHAPLVFFVTLALAMAVFAARGGRFPTYAAALAAAAGACTMRPEGFLLLPGFALLLLGAGPQVRRKLLRPHYLAATALFVWMILPVLLTTLGSTSSERFNPAGGAPESPGPLALLATLLVPDGRNAFLDPETSPLWVYPVAIYAVVIGIRRGGELRFVVSGLALVALAYYLVYANLPPAVTIWAMARYHMSLVPAVLALSLIGFDDLLGRLRLLADARRRAAAIGALAVAGLAIWSPALFALPLDWQHEHHFVIEAGREDPNPLAEGARLVAPDNRRRFRDMSPRDVAVALSRGALSHESVVTVEHAIRHLHVDGDRTEAYFYEGFFCEFARVSPEPVNPQCAAMHRTFELEPVARREVDAGPYLTVYAPKSTDGPFTMTLYCVGERRLGAEEGLALLPEPVEPDEQCPYPPETGPCSHVATYREPPEPPLGEPLRLR